MIPLRHLAPVLLAGLAVLVGPPAPADTPQDLVRKANEQFAAGRYADALKTYEQVDDSDPRVAAEVLYDRAAAQYKLGNLDDARELWVRAASLRDAAFEARCRYALGNCDYAAALKALDHKDAQHALESLGRAIEQYEDALRLDPDRADARANLELAARLKQQIEKATQKQPQSQPSQGDKQQKERKKQQDQQKKQPQSQPARRDKQSDQNKQSDQDKQSCPNPDERKQGDQSQQSKNDRRDQSQEQEQKNSSSQSEKSQKKNQQASGKKGAAAGKDQQQGKDTSAGKVPIRITKEEAQRLLQKIRDAEQRRRAMLRAREAARQKPVEKDW